MVRHPEEVVQNENRSASTFYTSAFLSNYRKYLAQFNRLHLTRSPFGAQAHARLAYHVRAGNPPLESR